MGKTKHKWWGYVKAVIRDYPEHCENIARPQLEKRESDAVARAIEATLLLRNGAERMELLDMVFFQKSYSLEGAAAARFVSYETAKRWHGDFITMVAAEMGLCAKPDKT